MNIASLSKWLKWIYAAVRLVYVPPTEKYSTFAVFMALSSNK